ncbi:MAG: AAA-like domain-containing protein [Bryobacteraceae bacterium]
MADVFISYRHAKPDEDLAKALRACLERRGVDVFLDQEISWGANWEREIGEQLRQARHFVVLLSEHSILSDAVREEVNRAYGQMKAGQTRILPLRLSSVLELPYHLALMLNPIQYARWDPANGTDQLCELVHAAILGAELPEKGSEVSATLPPSALGPALEEGAPLPSADLRLIESETGTVPLDSPFYVETALQKDIEAELGLGKGRTIIIKGPRQSGKSSQLLRAHDWATRNGQRSWLFSFQSLDERTFQDLDTLLRELAFRMEDDLGTSLRVGDVWDSARGAKRSFSRFVERAVLSEFAGRQVALCLDEVDLVFPQPYCSDFFQVFRDWHNRRATHPLPWRNLTMMMAHATDACRWIPGDVSSPFNVPNLRGLTQDFDAEQVAKLNQLYGAPLVSGQIPRLMALVAGQPFLIRQALYTLKKRNCSLEQLETMATRRDSPFADHLGGIRVLLDGDPDLAKAARQVEAAKGCDSESAFQRLLMAGLVDGETRRTAVIRCDLYRRFLREHA